MTQPCTDDDAIRLERGQRRVRCNCGAAECQGWAWARPDLCPPCLTGRHAEHMPLFFSSGSWCPCPDCDPLGPGQQPLLARLQAELDAAQLRSIEARNPGIDMAEVRRMRSRAQHSD